MVAAVRDKTARRAGRPGRIARRLALGLALASAASAAAAAGTSATLTLDDAAERAAASAPAVAAGRARETSAAADLERAGRLPDPQLELGVQNVPVQGSTALNLNADPTTMRVIGISQDIPSTAALDADRAGARAAGDAARADVAQSAIAARQAGAAAWVALWSSRLSERELAALADEAALAVAAARARLAGGTGTATDVLAAQASAAALANRQDAARGNEAAALASLQRWIGPVSGQLAPAPDFSRLPLPMARLMGEPDSQGPMLGWGARIAAAEAALSRARASVHPDWRISASYGVRAPGLPAMASVQLGMRLPLFAAEREDRDIDARAADLQALRDQREDARRAEVEAVAQALARWRSLNAQIARDQSTLLPLTQERVATALAAYRGGGALQPWIDAEQAAIATRIDWIDAQAERARAWTRLAYLSPESPR